MMVQTSAAARNLLWVVLPALFLIQCGDAPDDPVDGGGGGTAFATVRMYDSAAAPADNVDQILLTINDVRLTRSGAPARVVSTPVSFDALETSAPLPFTLAEDELVPSGGYNTVQVTFTSCVLVFNDSTPNQELVTGVPESASATANFTVPADGSVTITLDFQGDQSIIPSGASFTFDPVIRVATIDVD